MNRQGFTLIELLVTIVLLSIISLISFISINNVVKQSKINDCKALVTSIKSATKEYVSDLRYDSMIPLTIYGNNLTENNYLATPIYNPFNKNEIDPSNIIINITLDENDNINEISISEPAVLKECKNE